MKNSAQQIGLKVLKVLIISLVIILPVLFFITKNSPKASAVAGINRTINFQGKLINNPLKTNVNNTSYTVVFTFYDRASGGTVLWQETQTVNTADGIFRVSLGSVTPIPANFNFNWDGIYLGMKVNADSEMTPRIQMTAVPYAFNAQKVSGLTVQDDAGNSSTSATLRIANDKTVTFTNGLTFTGADSKTINFGSNSISFTTASDATLTLPTTGTLATLAGSEEFTNKTIGSTGLIFSGATTDITTVTNEDLTLSANGSGNIILAGDSDSSVTIGTATSKEFPLLIRAGISNNAALAIDNLNSGDLLTASAAGSTRFVIENDGDLKIAAGQSIDTLSAGSINLGTINATSAVLGSSALGSFTVTTDSTGDSEVSLPAQSIGASEILNNTIDYSKISNTPTLDADTTTSFSTFNQIFDLTSTGEFLIRDAGNNFAQFLADGTITLGKAASGGTFNLGIGTGADVISIGSNNTVGDTLVIGNDNTSTTLSLTGGDDWSITTAGAATFTSFAGSGLSDCDASTSKLLWNDATGTFSCGTDQGSNLQVVDFTDTTSEVATFTTAMDIWDGTYANITPGSTNSEILISVNIRGTSDDANDHNPVFTIRRAIGSNPTCSDTQIGGEFVGGFLTATAQDWGAAVTTSDAPASTGNVRYTVCTTTTGLDDANTDDVRIVLTEIGSSSGGGGGGNVSVRESDSSPSVASASTIEFGPATTSSDEFIVTDEGSGVARIRIGDMVGLLNEAEIVTGGWTFNTTATTFTTGILANGGINTATDTNLSLAAAGTGYIILTSDFNTGVKIGSSGNTPAPLSVSGGIGNNAALIVNQLNNGDIFAASSSGTTMFRIDNSGNIYPAGNINLSTGNLAFSSTGGITLTGGTIMDNSDEVDINDDLAVAGNISLTGTTGINLTGVGADFTFTNLEQISNDTNGTITFGRNDSGTVTLNARDDDATAALSIFSGGASTLTLDTGGAATLNIGNANSNSIVIGNSTSTTNLTFTKGASGNITLTGFNCSTLTNGGTLTTDASGNIECDDDDGGAATATYWDASQGALYPNNSTYDLLLGGTSTASAKFGFINVNNGAVPTATISAANGNAISINANGSITTTKAQSLTIGGGDSGEVYTASLLRLDSTNGIRGGGLSDCDNPTTAKLLWDSATNRFSCGTDQGGGGGSSITIRESDSSPAVSAVAVIEFGPASTSTDEFIVSDEGSSIGRVRIGNQVGMLNQAETVNGGWTFNTTATTFTTGILANGGLDTASNTDLNLAANGSGQIVLGTDADSGVKIGSSGNTPAVLSVSGGIGNNAALIVNNTNNGNIFVASASGTTRFAIDGSGNAQFFGGYLIDDVDGVDVNDDLDVSGSINLTTGNLTYSSTGGISLAGGNISDSVGSVLINDNLSVAGTTGITFTSTGSLNLAGGTISDSSGDVDINDNLTVSGTTGLTLSGSGADLIFANGESLTNDTNSTLTLKRNDAGTVVLNAADDDSTAALTINSGGAAALTLDTGGGAALSIGNTNATSVILGNTTNGTSVTINTGTGGLNIGDSANIKTIEIGGVDSDGGDTVRIATNATSADSINIGNANASTTMGLTGGTSWSISTNGSASFGNQVTVSNNGIEFTESDTNPTCASGNYNIFADLSETRLKKCQNGTVTNLDLVGADSQRSSTSLPFTTITTSATYLGQVSITPSTVTGDVTVRAFVTTNSNSNSNQTITAEIRVASGTTCGGSLLSSETAALESASGANGPSLVATYFVVDAGTSALTYAVCATTNVTNGADAEGTLTAEVIDTGADLAEFYTTNDESIEAGDIVSSDSTLETGVQKTTTRYQKDLFGIVSTFPALSIGNVKKEGKGAVPVALSGRVPVKVTTENGNIKAGDYLTSSNIPGVAMKANKSGAIIGIAMQDYIGEGIGKVLVFVKSGISNGNIESVLNDPKLDVNSATFSEDALRELKNQSDPGLSGSDVVTDRMIATVEIVTPKLTVDTLHARKIIVDEIEGLSAIESRIAQLEEKIATLSAATTFDKSLSVEVEYATLSSRLTENELKLEQQNKLMQMISDQIISSTKSAVATQNTETSEGELKSIVNSLRVTGNVFVEGVINVIDSIVANNIIVNGLATFFGDSVFKSKVDFEGQVTFSNESGGTAVIGKNEDKVRIDFDKEFDETPILNASVTFDEKRDEEGNVRPLDEVRDDYFAQDYEYIIVDKSKKGFVIVLNKKARDEISFTWTAIRIKDAKNYQSRKPD